MFLMLSLSAHDSPDDQELVNMREETKDGLLPGGKKSWRGSQSAIIADSAHVRAAFLSYIRIQYTF